MTAADRWIERCRRRFSLGQFLERAGSALAVSLFAVGGTILFVKLFLPHAWPHVLWTHLLILPAVVWSWVWSRREAFTRMQSAVWLDSRLAAGGLLLSLAEQPDDRWQASLPQFEQRWRDSLPKFWPAQFLKTLLLPTLFLAGAYWAPVRAIAIPPLLKPTVGQRVVQELEEFMKTVTQTPALENREKQELAAEIAKLAEETKHSPMTNERWEVVDMLKAKMDQRLESGSAEMRKAIAALAALKEARSGEASSELTPELEAKLESELLETLQKLGERGAFQNMPAGEAKDALERLMKQKKGEKREAQLKLRQEALDDLAKMLAEESERMDACRGKGECEGGNCRKPGSGGISRGRGDAEISFGDESNPDNIKFKEVVLPPGALDDPKDDVQNFTKGVPEEDPAASAPRGSSRQAADASGAESWSRQLNPRHRDVVRKYFQTRPEESKGTVAPQPAPAK